MKKHLQYLLVLLFLCAGTLSETSRVYAQVAADTVMSRTVAPGVVHTSYLAPGPRTLDVLAIDITNPYLNIQTYRTSALTRTTYQAAQIDAPGSRVVGSINGDFYSFETHRPTSNQTVKGEFVQGVGVGNNRFHFAIDDNKRPFIEQLQFQGHVKTGDDGPQHAILGVNRSHSGNSIVAYTRFEGGATPTASNTREVTLVLADGQEWKAGAPMQMRVVSSKANGGSVIPNSGLVLSGVTGSAADFLTTNLEVDDEIEIYLGFNPDLNNITDVMGGGVKVLDEGQVYSGTNTSQHPRTFVAINQDSTMVYFVTVDGRQASSVGMTYVQMANFLLSLDAWNGVNLDGGGSTTMAVRGQVVNSPSDPGGERSVANTLHVVSTAPQGTLHFLHITNPSTRVYQGASQQFTATGTDEYYNPISLPAGVNWSASAEIGEIDNDGLFTANSVNAEGYVYVTYNDVIDSVHVQVNTLDQLSIFPRTLNMVPGERLVLRGRALTTDGDIISPSNSDISFSLDGSGIDLNQDGTVVATGFGSGTITANIESVSVEIPFNTEGTPTGVLIESFEDLLFWDPVASGNDANVVETEIGPDPTNNEVSVLHINTNDASTGTSLTLGTEMPLSSRIDSFYVSAYGSGANETFDILFTDRSNRSFTLRATNSLSQANQWQTIAFAVEEVQSQIDFPVTLKGLKVNFTGSTEGTIHLKELIAHHPNRNVEPQVLFDFESTIAGWFTPQQTHNAQIHGVDKNASSMVRSNERAWLGDWSGKWTFVDDASSSTDWDIRITRGANQDLGNMLRGSYVGAWVYAEGETDLNLHIVIRDGDGQLEAGRPFPISHVGWKLIGTRLDDNLFTGYITGNGSLTGTGNQFNGFRVTGSNSDLDGQTRVFYIDHLVTNALTVPTGFHEVNASQMGEQAVIQWSVNSEMSVDRYIIERSDAGADQFSPVGSINAVVNTDTTETYQYNDSPTEIGTHTYDYRVRQITSDGAQTVSPVVSVEVTVSTSIDQSGDQPYEFGLLQNYPNPFNPSTTIPYTLGESASVRITIFNVLGQRIATPVQEVRPAGYHSIQFDASRLSSGMYVYQIEAEPVAGGQRYVSSRKFMLIK
ncbi:MAG: phosphodiester glycosidase family protein [Balneolales bacterium]|nr:phosphodiester glycosidase family protein [Balneolales bacterium]